MATQIQVRRDTEGDWNLANPILAQGEIGLVLDSNNNTVGLKVGNGTSVWKDLAHATPVMSGVANILENSSSAANQPVGGTGGSGDVTTFLLKGLEEQNAKILGVEAHDSTTLVFSVDKSGNVAVKGDTTIDAGKKVLIGADTGTTTGVQIKAETNYGQLMTRSSSSANATDAVIHHYNNNNSTFRVDNDGDIAKCTNIDASGVITTTSNVSAVNITGSGVLSMTGTAEHNIHGELDMNTKKIINVVDPTTNQGAATKKYVDDTVEAAKGWRWIETKTETGSNTSVTFSGLSGDDYMSFKLYVVDAYCTPGSSTTRFSVNSTHNDNDVMVFPTGSTRANGWIEVSSSISTTMKLIDARGYAAGAYPGSFANAPRSIGVTGNISSLTLQVLTENIYGTFVLYGLKLT